MFNLEDQYSMYYYNLISQNIEKKKKEKKGQILQQIEDNCNLINTDL